MMRACTIVLLLFPLANATQKPCAPPLWTVDLAAKYHFTDFGLPKHARNRPVEGWKTHQGVVFTGPEMLAIFRVEESDQLPPLAPRDASGGSGRFILHVEFLDSRQGNEVRSFRLITSSSDYSDIYPTHDGRFLLLTGQVMRLYSSTFEELASRPLSLSHVALNEWWMVAVGASGRRIYAEHYEYFGRDKPSRSERLLLDADTLQAIATVDPDDASWPGVVNLSHVWWKQFPRALVAKHEEVSSVQGNGSLLAAQTRRTRWNPLDLDLAPIPLRIVIYDLATKSERCSIPIGKAVSGWALYAVSPTGAVAVIQGNILSLHQP